MLALLTRVTIGLLAMVTLLPLLPVGAWWVRLFDFPRLQIAALVTLPLVSLCIWAWTAGWSWEHGLLLPVTIGIGLWQLSHVAPYLPVWGKELPSVSAGELADHSVSVVNLKFENEQRQQVLAQLKSIDSDLLLLIEINEAWNEALAPLADRYPHRVGVVREEGLGIMLFSKLPLSDPEVKHLVSKKRASIFARLRWHDGREVRFVGLHPTPPGLWDESQDERHDSRIRDAELLIVAKEAKESPDDDWLITGDFNDVAWSHTTRMFQRISGLKDPRVGRGLYNTYHAESRLFQFPIDQVFLSPTASIVDLDRFHPTGSDHFAITTTIAWDGTQPANPDPEGNDMEQADEMVAEGQEDSRKE